MFKQKQPVVYVPPHLTAYLLDVAAQTSLNEREAVQTALNEHLAVKRPTLAGVSDGLSTVQFGVVSKSNERFVFVKFHPWLSTAGWHDTVAQSCKREHVFERRPIAEDVGFVTGGVIRVGDVVEWVTGGLRKVGYVVGILQARDHVTDAEPFDFSMLPTDRHIEVFGRHTDPRDEVSYFVSVRTGKTDKAQRKLYHPRSVCLSMNQDGVYGA